MRALRHKLIWLVFLAAIIAVLTQMHNLQYIHNENRLIKDLLAGHDIDANQLAIAAPEVRLARAVYLRQKKRYQEAQDTLNLVISKGGPSLQILARYNMGNVLLEQALNEVDQGRINQAIPLLSLAKHAYKYALAMDHHFWDAKYNLESALRLLPEFERTNTGQQDDNNAQPPELWTTIPGFPRGMP